MERQLVTDPSQADASHVERYRFATRFVNGAILDIACGCGYGSHLLSRKGNVTGVDVEKSAITHAEKYFDGNFVCCDAIHYLDTWPQFDYAVSFETIEHMKDDVLFVEKLRDCANYLICSVPNENLYPFNEEVFKQDKYPHLRHYTPEEFRKLLTDAGWEITGEYCQKDKHNPVIREGVDGRFMVFTAK